MAIRPILLVEDNPDDADLIVRALKRARLANPTVRMDDGPSALDWLKGQGVWADQAHELPVFVLLDVKLPGMNGHEVLAAMRADPDLELVPVVMLTSSAQDRDRFESYRNGANAYVVKPVDFVELQKTVEALGYFWAIINRPPPPQ